MEPMNIHQEIPSENKPKGVVYVALKTLWFILILLFIFYAIDLSMYVRDFIISINNKGSILGLSINYRNYWDLVISIIFFINAVVFLFVVYFSRKFLFKEKYLKTGMSILFGFVFILFSTEHYLLRTFTVRTVDLFLPSSSADCKDFNLLRESCLLPSSSFVGSWREKRVFFPEKEPYARSFLSYCNTHLTIVDIDGDPYNGCQTETVTNDFSYESDLEWATVNDGMPTDWVRWTDRLNGVNVKKIGPIKNGRSYVIEVPSELLSHLPQEKKCVGDNEVSKCAVRNNKEVLLYFSVMTYKD